MIIQMAALERRQDIAEHGQELLSPEDVLAVREYDPAAFARLNVLSDTLARLGTPEKRKAYHALAAANLARWASQVDETKAATDTGAAADRSGAVIEVVAGDWGAVTLALTKRFGVCFGVLNMANAEIFGGGYARGMVAQEENMFRRTDCHFHDEGYDREVIFYSEEMQRLLSGTDGRVLLDTASPRVCIKGPEDRFDIAAADDEEEDEDEEDEGEEDEGEGEDDKSLGGEERGRRRRKRGGGTLGYPLLADTDVFPFFELRSAAVDMRGASRRTAYDPAELRKRIVAQLETCMTVGVKHVVLSAFGCGAFQNPAPIVAAVYKEEVLKRKTDFEVVAFAVFNAGYTGNDNFGVFRDILGGHES